MNELYLAKLHERIKERTEEEISHERLSFLITKVKALILCNSLIYTRIDNGWHSHQDKDIISETEKDMKGYLAVETLEERYELLTEMFPEVSIISICRIDPSPESIKVWDIEVISYNKHEKMVLETDYIAMLWAIAWAFKRWVLSILL